MQYLSVTGKLLRRFRLQDCYIIVCDKGLPTFVVLWVRPIFSESKKFAATRRKKLAAYLTYSFE